ncbi:MAG: hypothetical protein ACOC89_04345 [Candidatus Saliniplasma sp.]
MHRDDRGVAGFFVDIPALLTIIIAISIFTLSLFHAQSVYIREQKEEDMKQNLDDLISSFRRYHHISESPGVYNYENLEALNQSILNRTYDRQSLGFEYRIKITDNSFYENDYSFEFKTSPIPSHEQIYSRSSSVVVENDLGRVHLCSLKITIWEVG